MAIPRMDKKNSKRKCFWCIKAVKWIPVLFIVTIIVWSYYAYVIQLCIVTVHSVVKKIIYLIIYHITLIMFCWAYWKTIFTEIGKVPDKFHLPDSEYERLMHAETEEIQRHILENFSRELPNTNCTINGTVRYCEECKNIKPDRAHHCSVCGECVLKMDHHCPWVNNCVCFTNYKFFILFLAYSLIYCIFVSLTSLQYFIAFWKGDLEGMGKFHILFLFFVSLMFAVSLVSLFGYHCYLVIYNRTTLEAFRPAIFRTGPDKNGFSLGIYNNFLEVFGDDSKKWFLPVTSRFIIALLLKCVWLNTEAVFGIALCFNSMATGAPLCPLKILYFLHLIILGDGVTYPVQSQHQQRFYHSMDSTQNSLGDGYTFPQRHMDEDTEQLLINNQHLEEENFAVH